LKLIDTYSIITIS